MCDWLLPAIEREGLRACIDYRDFAIGKPSIINMEDAVVRSLKTLLVLTPAYVQSTWCEFENVLAQTRGLMDREVYLIPVLRIDTNLPTRIAMLTYLPMRDPAECAANLPRLLDALRPERLTMTDGGEKLPPWPPPIYLPPPAGTVPSWFVPRPEEADKVLRALGVLGDAGTPGRTVAMTAVHGMGGVGKTTLAAWLLRDERVRRRWPDGVLWATLGPDAKGEAAADAPLLLWGAALGEKGLRDYPRTEDKAAILRGLLAGRRVLLVVDDAWDSIPARLLLDCAGPDCGRLLTTRQWEVAVALDADPLRIDVMTPDEARTLLAKRAGERAMSRILPKDADELCARLDYLPLALNLAGAGLRGGTPVEEYLQVLRAEQGLDLLKLEEGQTREQSVRICLGISLQRLSDEERRRYAKLGVLAPGAPFGAIEAAIVWGLEPDDPAIPRLLRRLDYHALLDPLEGDGAPRYRQHALLREHALGLLDAEERRAAEQRHAARFLALAREHRNRETWLAFDPFHPQALAALDRAKQACEDGALPAEARDAARESVSEFVFALARYWDARGLFALARQWGEAAVECCHALGRRRDEGAHLGNLGLAYAGLGEARRAIDYHEQALTIAREIVDRKAEGSILGNLGSAYYRLGEVRRAIEYHEQALAIMREIEDRHGEAHFHFNLGLALKGEGDVAGAREQFAAALALYEAMGLPDAEDARRERARQ